jgi:predicted glycosyltransferase involved in capsule biosynthesis
MEDPRKNKPTFVPKKMTVYEQRIINKKSQNVGSNKRDAQLLEEFLKNKNIQHYLIRPSKKTMSKIKVDMFEKITGYTERTSQHGRDAAMLVWGL